MEMTQPIEPFDGESQGHDEPLDQQAVALVVADVLHAVTVLGVVETLVLDLSAALGHEVEAAANSAGTLPFNRATTGSPSAAAALRNGAVAYSLSPVP